MEATGEQVQGADTAEVASVHREEGEDRDVGAVCPLLAEEVQNRDQHPEVGVLPSSAQGQVDQVDRRDLADQVGVRSQQVELDLGGLAEAAEVILGALVVERDRLGLEALDLGHAV